ncbi:hypothetical protein GFPCMMHI_01753 [Ensifer adhaerens]|nr:hypothetical protein [Ensifer adhaerens]
MVDLVIGSALAGRLVLFQKIGAARQKSAVLRQVLSLTLTLLLALSIVIAVEWIVRGEFSTVPSYLFSPSRPGFTTIGIVMLTMLILDAALGRAHLSVLIVAPLLLVPAFISSQKQNYLSDPLYPSDFLFARQIMELMPVMVRDRRGPPRHSPSASLRPSPPSPFCGAMLGNTPPRYRKRRA